MDAMNVFRSTQLGTIGTSFGSTAFNNTVPGRLTEDRFSIQNSRIGLRTHAKFGSADITGYLEADFLGYQPRTPTTRATAIRSACASTGWMSSRASGSPRRAILELPDA